MATSSCNSSVVSVESQRARTAATHRAEDDFRPSRAGIFDWTAQWRFSSSTGSSCPAAIQAATMCGRMPSLSWSSRLLFLSRTRTKIGSSRAMLAPYPVPAAWRRLHAPWAVPCPNTAICQRSSDGAEMLCPTCRVDVEE